MMGLKNQRTRTLCSNSGFSLVEVLITVLVTVVLAGFAVTPIREGINRYRLGSAAQRLAAELQRARSLAQAGGTMFQVSIDANTGTLKVIDLSDAAKVRTEHTLSGGITFDQTPLNTLLFYPRGYARGGDIVLAGPHGKRARISLSASGRTVVDILPDFEAIELTEQPK